MNPTNHLKFETDGRQRYLERWCDGEFEILLEEQPTTRTQRDAISKNQNQRKLYVHTNKREDFTEAKQEKPRQDK